MLSSPSIIFCKENHLGKICFCKIEPLKTLILLLRQRQLNFFCMGSQENYFLSVGRQNMNNNLKFQGQQGHLKKNADHRVKETCAIISIQVTYETNHISLLHDSTMLNALIFVFYVFYCNLKEKKSY